MSSTTLTIDQLCLSPFNVRTNQQDATATTALEASILARGLILPLVVHPMRGSKKYGVYAGGRRYRSIKALIERGDLARDWPVDVVIRDLPEAELIEVSAAENLLRRDLRPYELFAAVAKAHRKGDRPEKIAETLGQEIAWVRQSLRLGNLAAPIFDALEAEQISVDQARAYAATEDQALQLATFDVLNRLQDWEKTPAKIRAHIGFGDAEAERLLRFVGADAYVEAGGKLELDLFADGVEERGRIIDVEILRGLADEKLASVRDAVRIRTGRRELRFVPTPPQSGYGGHDYTLQVTPKAIDPDTIQIPDGDIVAHIRLPEAGDPEVTYWWASRKAKHGVDKPERKPPIGKIRVGAALRSNESTGTAGMRQAADSAIKEEAGLSQDAIQIFRSVRRAIMRAAFVEDAAAGGDVAIDYFVWSQLRITMKGDFAYQLGLRGLAPGDNANGNEIARDYIAATDASRMWGQALYELTQQTFMSGEDLVEAYRVYRASPPMLKRQAMAVVAGFALERSLNADHYRLPVHDALAQDLDLLTDERIRTFWRPTAAMLELLSKPQRLAVAEPLVEAASFGPWQRLKGAEITSLVLQVVTGAANTVRASMAAAAATWVHPLLQFSAVDDAAAGVEHQVREAAE